ncbi:hypothetical protein [Hyphomicrobium sp. D-2]|uniref:hypothetical protein n=1 Tax=Hyphomicrobium sp. D-2 TaxID=3041621 RepID=UPI0024554B97|nr:hypothetical protein [Hyphomicrobium sp. D-2]MDH4981244.1 hypothetical protein [Hyphomicrobium sp. D-2]
MTSDRCLKAAQAGQKRDRAFFNCNPERHFRARRALPHEAKYWSSSKDEIDGTEVWLLVWRNPLGEIIPMVVKPNSRTAIVDDEAFLSELFASTNSHKDFGKPGFIQFSGEQALAWRQKAGVQ